MISASEYLAQGEGEWVQMTCGHCGQTSGWMKWTNTAISGELPPGEFQCPKCGRAFKRERHHGDPWSLIDGKWVYRTVDLVPIPTRL